MLAMSLLQAVHGDFSYTAVAYQDSLQYGDVSCLFHSFSVMCRSEECWKELHAVSHHQMQQYPPSSFSGAETCAKVSRWSDAGSPVEGNRHFQYT